MHQILTEIVCHFHETLQSKAENLSGKSEYIFLGNFSAKWEKYKFVMA